MCGNFSNFSEMQKYVQNSPAMNCSSHVYEGGRGPSGVAIPPNLALGPHTCLEMWWQVQTPRHAAPECDPLHGRRCRQHLEVGNGHVGLTQRESCGGFGPDLVLKCSYGLAYQNQVKTSIDQSPSGESQRRRSSGRHGR
jgi:hypothetical protein